MTKKEKCSPASLGWAFTQEVEERIERAARAAASFMAVYGRGKRPKQIDKTKYIQ